MSAVINSQTETLAIEIPKVDLQRLKGIAEAMGWKLKSIQEADASQPTTEEWSEQEEREAFLHTSRVNAANMMSKYL